MNEIRTILVAEDNPNDVELTLEALGGYRIANEIAIVRDGAQALDYLYRRGEFAQRKPGNPAVILLDLKRVPVVVLTSSREEKDLVRSYDLGVNAFVVKPVSFEEFVDAVKQVGAFWAVLNEIPPHSS